MINLKYFRPKKFKADEKSRKNIFLYYHIRSIINSKPKNSGKYNEKYMNIKFKSNGDLPQKVTLEFHNIIIV